MKEYILCAANHYDDKKEYVHQPTNIKTGFVICGRMRHNIYMSICIITENSIKNNWLKKLFLKHSPFKIIRPLEGFITSTNLFVNREEAAKIAFTAKQISEIKNKLYSEDLYGNHLYKN